MYSSILDANYKVIKIMKKTCFTPKLVENVHKKIFTTGK